MRWSEEADVERRRAEAARREIETRAAAEIKSVRDTENSRCASLLDAASREKEILERRHAAELKAEKLVF